MSAKTQHRDRNTETAERLCPKRHSREARASSIPPHESEPAKEPKDEYGRPDTIPRLLVTLYRRPQTLAQQGRAVLCEPESNRQATASDEPDQRPAARIGQSACRIENHRAYHHEPQQGKEDIDRGAKLTNLDLCPRSKSTHLFQSTASARVRSKASTIHRASVGWRSPSGPSPHRHSSACSPTTGGPVEGSPRTEAGATGIDDDFFARSFQNVGAYIFGRNMFGPARGRGATTPGRAGGDRPRRFALRYSC